jgi:hypothetical protein
MCPFSQYINASKPGDIAFIQVVSIKRALLQPKPRVFKNCAGFERSVTI